MSKTMILAGVAVLALGGAAVAQQPGADRVMTRETLVDRQVERLRAMDADGDGQVSQAEAEASRAERMAERRVAAFDRLDADKDGMISRAEFEARPERAGPRAAHRGPRGERRAQRVAERYPISIAEAETRAAERFARMDANGDGQVTADERRAARDAMRAERRASRATASSE